MATKSKKITRGTKVAKELQPTEVTEVPGVEEELSLDLENEDGILGRVNKTKSRETHLRYVTFNAGITKTLDIRQFTISTKYTGYTSKGITIPEKDLPAFRDYINMITDAVLAGEIEAKHLTLAK